MPRYRIRLQRKDGPTEECKGEFSDDDWTLFERFRDLAGDLATAEWVRAGLDSRYTIDGDASGSMVVTAPGRPSDAQVREILLLLRPFVLQGEPTYFPKVSGRMRQYMTHVHLQRVIDERREHFAGTRQESMVTITSHELELNNERTLTLWLNSFGGYHSDGDKREEFERRHGRPPDELALAIFRDLLAAKAESVLWLADFVTQLENAPSNRASSPAQP